jgi:PAB1-binding protein PBP1
MKRQLQMLLLAAAAAAFATGAHAQGKLYKWTDASGKVHYTDKMPAEAAGRASEELNKQGTVVRRTEAPLSAEQRAERDRERQRKRDEDAALREQKRKDMALLNTYSTERDIEEARGRALRANQEALQDAERKLADARKRGDKLRAESEFYAKKPMPKQLQQDLQVNELEIRTQNEVIEAKRKDVAGINAKYDEDRRRYLELVGGSKTAQGPSPVATR